MSGLNSPNIGHPVKSQLSLFRTRCDSVGHGTSMCSLVPSVQTYSSSAVSESLSTVYTFKQGYDSLEHVESQVSDHCLDFRRMICSFLAGHPD